MQDSATKKFEDARWKTRTQSFVFRHKKALELIKGSKVLDIGSGDGIFLEALRKRGVTAKGVDISEEAVKKCQARGFEAVCHDVSAGKLPFKDDEFDEVVMLDILEHLYLPEQLLGEARRVSRKYIVLGVPNFNSLPARVQMLLGRVPENNIHSQGHIYWFNYEVLVEMLARHKLKLVTLGTNVFWENNMFVGWLMKLLVAMNPALFALSFVIKVEKL